jgi:hypothetical protein
MGDTLCLRRPAFVLRPPRLRTALRYALRQRLPPMTLRRIGSLLFCLHPRSRATSDKTSGPTATRGSSYTARPLPLPRFLYSFVAWAVASDGSLSHVYA